jgi:hypothetical protein
MTYNETNLVNDIINNKLLKMQDNKMIVIYEKIGFFTTIRGLNIFS